MNLIISILPYKENFTELGGAVAIGLKEQILNSKFKNSLYVYGKKTSNIIDKKRFISYSSNSKIFNNKFYINNFIKIFKDNKEIKIIEIHNRPVYLQALKKKLLNKKIFFYFHNNPFSLKGSETINERIYIYENTDHIFFLSNWIKQKFFEGFDFYSSDKYSIIYPAIKKSSQFLLNKNKNVVFIGRLNKSKGYDVYLKACKILKKKFNNWSFESIGSEPRRDIKPISEVFELGQVPHNDVLKYLKKTSIAVANSTWEEPLGRVAIEASANGCLPITTNVGGMIETNKYGIVLKKNTPKELFSEINKLIKNPKLLLKKQKICYDNFYFSRNITIEKIDKIREKYIFKSKNININFNRPIKILHISNFNKIFNGRLYYSSSNKINNGFVSLNHNVYTISDRDFFKYNNSLLNKKKFNENIYQTVGYFNPDVIILGHVKNIEESTFEKIKKIKSNLKIGRWYIDSISNEFFDNNKKVLFNNINYIDKCFVSSNPKKLNNKKFFYIPNPTDISIDYLQNFKKNKFIFDLFFAVSHGQNRGILKSGKNDERENFIKNLDAKLYNINSCYLGMGERNPVWGSSFYEYLSNSKMALNISRGSYQDLYSSDRISSLIGNGLLVFMNQSSNFNKFFSNNEIIFFKDICDLEDKIKFFQNNDHLRKKIAKNAYLKYHKYFNNKIVCKYLLSSLGFGKKLNTKWDFANE